MKDKKQKPKLQKGKRQQKKLQLQIKELRKNPHLQKVLLLLTLLMNLKQY
jgi:hypothetical protein